MKKILVAGIAAFFTIFSSGCLHVFQPPFSEEDLITNDHVTGKWIYDNETIIIEPAEKSKLTEMFRIDIGKKDQPQVNTDPEKKDKSYVMSYKKNNLQYYYSLQLARLNNQLYVQLLPLVATPADGRENFESRWTGFFGEEVIGTYAIAKIDIDSKDQIHFAFFNGDKIRQLIMSGKIKMPHVFDPAYDNFQVTAESNMLKSFIGKYGKDESLFSHDHQFVLTRGSK